jgi:hypothetical protein
MVDTGKPNWKPLPHKVAKRTRSRADAIEDDRRREQVRIHHGRKCLVCRRRTNVVHEHKRRGAGGEVSLQNSYTACDEIDGGLCHPLLQRRRIMPVCRVEPFDAREIEAFEMSEEIAALVFERRPRPEHIRIV